MLRKAKRLVIPVAIIIFWSVMMGVLLYREVILPSMRPHMATSRVNRPETSWMGLFFGEQRVGFVHWRTSPLQRQDDPGYSLEVLARMNMPLFGQSADLNLTGHAWQSGMYGLRDFDFTLRSGENEMRIEGGIVDNQLDARVHVAEDVFPLKMPVQRELLLGGGMGLSSVALPVLEPGQTVYVDTFDPTTMAVSKAKIEALERTPLKVGDKSLETLVLRTTIGGISTKAWVIKEGEVVRAETPIGLVLQKISPEEAVAPLKPGEGANLLSSVAIKPTGKEPKRDARKMRVKITGVPADRMPPMTSVQQGKGDVYEIAVLDPITRPSEKEPITGPDVEHYLSGDAFITSDHPKVKAQAAEITAGVDNDWEKASRLVVWVYDNIEKRHVLSMPNALDVLRTRQGDCNEHAVLYVALARALGIPARVAIGLAWSEEIKAFGYHAWAEVYAGRWIPVDPTFGETFADATHIKLLDGSIEDWPRLLGYVGNIKIEVLEVE